MANKTTTWAIAALALTGALAGGLACVIDPDGPQTYEEALFQLVPTTSAGAVLDARSIARQFCTDVEPDAVLLANLTTRLQDGWNATMSAFAAPDPFGEEETLPGEELPETLETRANASVAGLVNKVEAFVDAPTPGEPVVGFDVGLAAQADVLGVTPVYPTLRTFSSPSAAGRALMAQAGETPTDEDLADLALLDGAPVAVRDASVRLFAALLALDESVLAAMDSRPSQWPCDLLDHRLDAFGRADATAIDALDAALPGRLLAELGGDLSRLLGARVAVVEASVALSEAVEETMPDDPLPVPPAPVASRGVGVTGGTCKFFKIDFGGSDTYNNDYRVLLEFGGDDDYRNNAGGNHCGGTCVVKPWALAIDFKGSDDFGDASSRMDCGINGGAYTPGGVGLGFLLDFGKKSPDDRYYAGKKGTNGGAYARTGFALGFIYDHEGKDTYDAQDYGTNGGACALVGVALALAFDRKGDDTHKAGDVGTNGGTAGPISLALHWDFDGADTYQGGKIGVNGGATAGSVAILVDSAGKDTYNAGNFFTNGGAGIVGFGFLLDASGDDTYSAGGTATNGGAGLIALSYLRDGGGKDTYSAGSIATNGGAVLIALAFLTDRGAGDDHYRAYDIATNGGGILLGFGHVKDHGGHDATDATHIATNGAAILLATGVVRGLGVGNDHYNATGTATNGGAIAIARGRILDEGGVDSYKAGSLATNGGAAVVAWGNIVDDGGDDRYVASDVATNGGGFLVAWGRILDYGGHDTYDAGTCGVNGGACLGGNGTLVDFGGNDTYQASRFGANGGGFGMWLFPRVYSKGLLVDESGDDKYLAKSDGSDGFNGGGAYWGIGFLRDEGGHDQYVGGVLVTGGGHVPRFDGGDCGVNGGACWQGDGSLTDLGVGDDKYLAGAKGTNGGIFNTARQGTLIDQCGVDLYEADRDGSNGGAAWSFFMLDDMGAGRLVDMGGVGDTYRDNMVPWGTDATYTRKLNYHGDQLDSGPIPCPYPKVPTGPIDPTRPDAGTVLPVPSPAAASSPMPAWVLRVLAAWPAMLGGTLHGVAEHPEAAVAAHLGPDVESFVARLGGAA